MLYEDPGCHIHPHWKARLVQPDRLLRCCRDRKTIQNTFSNDGFGIIFAHQMMQPRLLLDNKELELILERLCYQLIENHDDFDSTALIALQPRGVYLGRRLKKRLETIKPGVKLLYGELDVTFYRDDFRTRNEVLVPSSTKLDFLVHDKKVVLIDDVLFTGRTVRAGMDALMDFGRPTKVELLALIDRRFSRHLPVQPDYTGRTVDAIAHEKVKVEWTEDELDDRVTLYTA